MEKEPLAETAVNQIEKVFGKYPGYRRAHARGEIYEGVFSANGAAAPLTTAPHFQQGEVKVLVRFSHSSPDPTWTDVMSPVKGMAVQFQLPEGAVANIVGVNSPIFMAKTPEVFTEMLSIVKSFKKGKPRVAGLAELVVKYPESRAAIDVLKKMHAPASFATGRYHAIHAFYFIDKDGNKRPIKYEWEPEAGVDTLSLTKAAVMPIEYYKADFEDRLMQGPVHFYLNIVLGEQQDPTDDPTQEWPVEREKITIGRLSIMKKVGNAEMVVFDPTAVTEGIACSEDRILNFRHDAYSISHNRRTNGE
ncbi:catalase family peroxidase [Planococcus sp. N028]|uniref:Catalase-related peroxidase n=1 Tax=Planococcus shixiaomingii TaxID=3058393 RepID=A0ABT8N5N3_9BACL|nr:MULTISPECIES: catalase family peroxidase [unclassified Planococcus (in: firmicutes)]MDN7243196.1 catalase family peroxidase [Planococcus sp. N028]WKA55139.1 catalase family peroxidase [Planococcus sp. N022]